MAIKVNRVVNCVDCDVVIKTPMVNKRVIPLCDKCLAKSIQRTARPTA
jgi:uncharacterized paraquat-inducible protein A